ncbi:MAG TPA: 3-hydroxy-5-phosphonooxypentane-2,4-dione thiolase [Rectinemataceae bacterium]|nr:3-hydroxy-5-phosphonooxypentane-2,4-dione thiolase [Rectinemataceae bacterium]
MFDHMPWGKKNRLSSIIASDGRALMLAIDHGYFMGPTMGMEKPAQAIAPLVPYVDSLMLSPGILTTCVPTDFAKGIVLRASGGNTVLDADIDDEELILEAQEAVRRNASAVAVSVFIGAEHGHRSLINLSDMINAAAKFDLPVLGVTAVGKALKDKKEKRYLAHASRICAELGSDIVKTYYCEGFEEVVAKCPVPIVVAGGPKLDTDEDVLSLCYNSIQCGAIGVDMGRNVWQHAYPEAILAGVRGVIHGGLNVKQALELVESMKGEKTRRVELFSVSREDIETSRLH